MFHFLSPGTPVGFEEFLRTSFHREPPGNWLRSKGNLHNCTVASIFWCSCGENDPLKSTFGDKCPRFSEKISIKVSKYILNIHGKAHL